MEERELKIHSVFFAGFLLALYFALTYYINSSFLASFLPETSVGMLYIFGAIFTVLALLVVPEILKKLGARKFLLSSIGINAVCLLALSIFKEVVIIIPVFILGFVINNVIVFSLDEILEIFTKTSSTGKIRGLYLALTSAAWVLVQGLVVKIIDNTFLPGIYFLSFEIMVALFFFAFFYLKNLPNPRYDRALAWVAVRNFFKNKNLAKAYKINFVLQFFYSWMAIYTPIYLYAHLGFTWDQIGTIFAVMLLPFVIMPLQLGKYADNFGERKILMLGFAIMSVSTMLLFTLKIPSVILWALLLLATRLGASAVDIMSDTYFFKHITAANDEFIGIYRNTSSIAYVLGPLVALLLLLILPAFNFLFLALGIFMLYGIYLSSTIKKSDI